jgi:hypothetical protein
LLIEEGDDDGGAIDQVREGPCETREATSFEAIHSNLARDLIVISDKFTDAW